jgi:hypothetical protein
MHQENLATNAATNVAADNATLAYVPFGGLENISLVQ